MDFRELLKRISPTLKRITYKLNGHFSFFNDQDLYQEATLHLWEAFQAGTLQDKTDSYILQGCFFHLKNYLRTVKNRTPLVSIDSLCYEDERGSTLEEYLPARRGESPFDYLHRKILVEDIRGNGLTPREKEVLGLFLQGLNFREIGRRLGVSHVTVVKIKASIRKKSNYLFD